MLKHAAPPLCLVMYNSPRRVQNKPIYWEGARQPMIKVPWNIITKKMFCVLSKKAEGNDKNVLICKFRDYLHCH